MTTDNTGFEQPNYTQTPNALFDKYLAEIDSMTELKVVLAIVRKTLGWHKTRDIISITQLEKMTGLSRQGVIDGVEKAITRGLVDRKPVGQGYYYRLKVAEPVEFEPEPTSQEERPATSQKIGLASQNFRLPLVNDLDQQLVNNLDTQKKGLNKLKETSSKERENPRPPKSEAVLIEEYFLKATTGSNGFMSAMQRELITNLVKEGYTLERCKPGIDQTIAEMNDKHKSVGSFKICIPAIYQLDPLKKKTNVVNFSQPGQPRQKTQADLDREADLKRWQMERRQQMPWLYENNPQPQTVLA